MLLHTVQEGPEEPGGRERQRLPSENDDLARGHEPLDLDPLRRAVPRLERPAHDIQAGDSCTRRDRDHAEISVWGLPEHSAASSCCFVGGSVFSARALDDLLKGAQNRPAQPGSEAVGEGWRHGALVRVHAAETRGQRGKNDGVVPYSVPPYARDFPRRTQVVRLGRCC